MFLEYVPVNSTDLSSTLLISDPKIAVYWLSTWFEEIYWLATDFAVNLILKVYIQKLSLCVFHNYEYVIMLQVWSAT